MLAAVRGDSELCRLLLEGGADALMLDKTGNDAFALAIGKGHAAAVAVIHEYLPDWELDAPNSLATTDEVVPVAAEFNAIGNSCPDIFEWEEEIESPPPAGDSVYLSAAAALQVKINAHILIDTAEDWSDVDISFPEVELGRFGQTVDADAHNRMRQLFFEGLRDGIVPLQRIHELVGGEDQEKDGNVIERLCLTLGDLGVQIDDDPVADVVRHSDPAYDEDGSQSSRMLVHEALTFLEDLNSAIGDPFNAYLKDIGREQLLSREEETRLGQEIEAGLAAAVRAVSRCATTVAEILRVAGDILNNETPLEYMVDLTSVRL
jgi:hypothetical protein